MGGKGEGRGGKQEGKRGEKREGVSPRMKILATALSVGAFLRN